MRCTIKFFAVLTIVFCALAAEAQFNPLQVPNLALWLRADSAVTTVSGAVSQWSDISGNGNHATQGTASKRPPLAAADCAINNKPSVSFNGTSSLLNGTTIAGLDTSAVQVFIVAKGNNTAQTGVKSFIQFGAYNGGLGLGQYGAGTGSSLFSRNAASLTPFTYYLPLTGFPYTLMELNKVPNTSFKLNVNGTTVYSTTAAGFTANFTNGAYSLGFGNAYFAGNIAELLVYKGSISAGDQQLIEDYLYNRYSPAVNLGNDTTISSGFCPVTINAGCYKSYLWSTGDTTANITVSNSGNYSVTVTDNFGRTSSDSKLVSYAVNTNLYPGNTTICAGGSVLLYPQMGNFTGYTFLWQNNAVTSSITAANPGSYYVKITDASGCFRYSDTIVLAQDNFAQQVSLGPDQNLCAGNKIALTSPLTGWGQFQFQWSDASTDSTYTVSSSGNISLTVTNQNGCIGRDTIHINVSGVAPAVAFVADTFCAGVPYQPVNTGDTAGVSMVWYFGNGDSSTFKQPTYLYPAAGYYAVTLKSTSASGCVASVSHVVGVKTTPLADFNALVACINNDYQFTDASSAPAGGSLTNWLWDFGDGNTAAVQNPAHIYSAAGNYNVSLTVTGSTGCAKTVIKPLSVVSTYSAPSAPALLYPPSQYASPFAAVNFEWAAATNAVRYKLVYSTSSTFLSGNTEISTTGLSAAVVLPAHGTYYWQVRAYNICGDSMVSSTRSVSLFIPTDITGLSLWLAADSAVTSAGGAVSQWDDISGNGNHAVQTSGSKKPVLLAPDCSINNKPAISFNGTSQVLNGTTINDLDTSTVQVFVVARGNNTAQTGVKSFVQFGAYNGGLGYGQYGAGTGSSFFSRNAASLTPFVYALPLSGFPYTLFELNKVPNTSFKLGVNGTTVYNSTASGFTGNFTNGAYTLGFGNAYFAGNIAEVLVYKGPITASQQQLIENYLYNKYSPSVNLGPDTTITSGFCPVTLNAGCYKTYAWSTGDTTATITVNTTGAYSVTVTDNFGRTSSDSKQVNYAVNTHLFPGNTTVCSGGSVVIYPLLGNFNGYNFLWQDGSTSSSVTANTSGNYYVQITDGSGCSKYSDTVTVTLDNFAQQLSLGPDQNLCAGNKISLVSPLTGWDQYQFQWSGGSSDSTYTVSSTANISLTVTNQNGCIGRDTIQVNVSGSAPVAQFTVSPICSNQPYVPANTSYSTDASPLTGYVWYFGNGDSSLSANPVYNYPSSGNYAVTLKVTAASGCSNTTSQVLIVHAAPYALFQANASCVNSAVLFADQSTTAAPGTILNWSWSYGDGGNSNQQSPQHTYTQAGNYPVTLAVANSDGCSDTLVQNLQVVSTFFAPQQVSLVNPLNNYQSTSGAITFTWNAAQYASSYALIYSTDPAFNTGTTLVYTANTQYSIVAGSNQTYYWQVRAYNICGDSSSSVARTFTIFSPTNLGCMALWLKSDTGVVMTAGAVSQWNDVSGNNNNCTQGTVSKRPLLTAPDPKLNNKPAIKFDGVASQLNGTTINGLDTANVQVFVVASGSSTAQTGVKSILEFGAYSSGLSFGQYGSGTNSSLFGRNKTSLTPFVYYLPLGGFNYTLFEMNKVPNVSFNLGVNANTVYTNTTSGFTTPFTNGNYSLGFGNAYFSGNVAEVLVYNCPLLPVEKQQVENYLFNKYAPPVNLGADINETYKLCPITLNAGNQFASYLWSTGDTGISALNVRASGTYWVRVVDVFGRTSTDTVNVVMPYGGMNTNDTVVCTPATVSLAPLLNSSPYNVQWYLNDVSNPLATGFSYATNVAGNYFAVISDTTGCGFLSDTIFVNVDSFAFQALLPADTTICEGNDISLNPGSYTLQSVVWNTGATGSSITITATTDLSVIAQDVNGCIAVDTVHITKGWVAPLTDFTVTNACLGDTVYLSDISLPLAPDHIKTYTWDLGDNATATGQLVAHYYNLPGSYQVQMVVVTDSGCTGFKQKTVKVSSSPVASFAYNGPVCAGTTLSFIDNSTVTGGDVITNWNWTFNTNDNYNTKNVAYTFLNQGVLPVQLIVTSNLGCTDTVQQTVEVFAYFEADFDYANVCLGDATQFTDQTQSLAVVSWTWDFGDGNASLTQNPQHTYAGASSYLVTLLAENAIGCIDTAMHTVNIVQPPAVDFTGTVGCFAQTYQPQDITVSPSEPIVAWHWNINGSHYNVQAPQHQFADSGTYQVRLVVTTQNGCVDSLTRNVSVKSNPVADFGIYPLYGEAPATITFTNESEGASTYQWYFGDGSFSNDENPSYTFLSNDTFTISLVAYSQYGCSDSIARTFIVAPTTLDVAVTNVETELKPLSDGTIEVTVKARLSNLGTRVITDLRLYATIGTGGVFTEDWSGLLYSGLVTPYTFTAKFIISADHAGTYVCVEAKEVNKGEVEVTTDNNKQCVSLNEAIQLVGPSPNPSSDHATLGVILPKAGTVSIAVVNNLGQYVLPEKNYEMPAGRTDFELPIEGMRTGEYYVRVKYNDDKLLRKFMVRR